MIYVSYFWGGNQNKYW